MRLKWLSVAHVLATHLQGVAWEPTIMSRNLTILFLLVIAPSSGVAHTRTWTDDTGEFTIEAELVDVVGKAVRLRKSDGGVIVVPLERLSEADRQHVQSRSDTPAETTQATPQSEAAMKRAGTPGRSQTTPVEAEPKAEAEPEAEPEAGVEGHQVYDVKYLEDLGEGESILLTMGVFQGAVNMRMDRRDGPDFAPDSPEFIPFGHVKVTLLEKGRDTADFLTPEQKARIAEVAQGFVENAHMQRQKWLAPGGMLAHHAYIFAYRLVVLGEPLRGYQYLPNVPPHVPFMEFGERIPIDHTAQVVPPGSWVAGIGGPEMFGGFGSRQPGSWYGASRGQTVLHHALRQKPPQYFVSYRMPTFSYRFTVDTMVFWDEFVHGKRGIAPLFMPLMWRKYYPAAWIETAVQKSRLHQGDLDQRIMHLIHDDKSKYRVLTVAPGTAIEAEFLPAEGWQWLGWKDGRKGPLKMKVDEHSTITLRVRKK